MISILQYEPSGLLCSQFQQFIVFIIHYHSAGKLWSYPLLKTFLNKGIIILLLSAVLIKLKTLNEENVAILNGDLCS